MVEVDLRKIFNKNEYGSIMKGLRERSEMLDVADKLMERGVTAQEIDEIFKKADEA